MLKRYTSHCIPCPTSFYLPTDGLYTVRYFRNTSEVQIHDPLLGSSDLQCLDCPYGAECTGSLLKPKPNFWGYNMKVKFSSSNVPQGIAAQALKVSPVAVTMFVQQTELATYVVLVKKDIPYHIFK